MPEPSWPEMSAVARRVSLPAGVHVRQLARAELPGLLATLAAWQPELGLVDGALLEPELHERSTAFAGEDRCPLRRPLLVLALDAGPRGALAYLLLEYERSDFLTYELGEGALELRLRALDPQRRSGELDRVLIELAVEVARATAGVHLLSHYVALDDRPTCALLEQTGLRPWALLPNAGLRRVGEGTVHVPEAIWLAQLGDPNQTRWPEPEGLRPRTAALLSLVSGRDEPAGPDEDTSAPARAVRPAPPELDPALAAELARRPGGRDSWPDIAKIAASLDLPAGIRVRQLARADLPRVLEQLPVWHPPLLESTIEFLAPESYERVAMAGEDGDVARRPGFALVAEVEGELAVFASYSFRTGRSRRLRGELAIVNPAHRRAGLTNLLTPLWVLLARALEADTILGWATLAHPYTQLACERQGLDLVGVLPSELDVDEQGRTIHVFEALYAGSFVPDGRWICPPLSHMPARVAALARFVLGARVPETNHERA